MAAEIILPKIDEAMIEGEIIEWLKMEGEKVEKGDILFVIETEKVTWEVESEESGILSKHLFSRGDVVKVGKIVAWILQEGEAMPDDECIAQNDDPVKADLDKVGKISPQTPNNYPNANKNGDKKIKASPLAKKIAKENGIPLEDIIIASGDNRIKKADVLDHLSKIKKAKDILPITTMHAPENDTDSELIEVSTMRKTIASRMTESFQTVPHFFLTVEVETDELIKLREKLLPNIEQTTNKRLTLTDLFIKVAAKAVVDVPEVNAQWTDEGLLQKKEINIGVAVNVKNGLVVPVIKNANAKILSQIVETRFDLVERAREGKLLPKEMKGGSLTVSNLGMYGIDQFCPIINPPESCILGIGQGVKKQVIRNDQVVIRTITNFTLAIDHRVLDGGIGSRFLKSVKDSIENPLLLL